MLFRLAGTAFTLATFPGIVVAAALQDGTASSLGVPTRPRLRAVAPQPTLSDPATRHVALAAAEADGEVEYVADYAAVAGYGDAVVVTLAPFLCCSLLAAGLLAAAAQTVPFWTLGWWLLTWLGLSVAAQSFPDPAAARVLWRRSAEASGVFRYVGLPTAAAALAADALSFLRFDALYASMLYYAVAAALFPGMPALALPVP